MFRTRSRPPIRQPPAATDVENQPGGTIAACHFPLIDEEVERRLPLALRRRPREAEPTAL